MKNISTPAELKKAIHLLEEEKSVHFQEMKANFYTVYESFRPANLIENTLKMIGSSPFLFNNVFNATIGLLAGYLSKKVLIVSRSNKKSGQLLGLILQFGVTNLVTYAPDAIKSLTHYLFNNGKRKAKSDYHN